MTRERHLLAQPAETVVRHLARQWVEEAQGAASRLDGADPEALHDFRVAVRRLRTLLRAWRPMELMPKKVSRRLRELARATNEARDLEVALDNLRPFVQADPALQSLRDRMADRCRDARAHTIAELQERWPTLAARLRRALDLAPRQATPVFGAEAARLVAVQRENLLARLDELSAGWHDDTAHAARLAGKRLRYLLEPLTGELPAAKSAVVALKGFQDGFGHYHDLSVLLAIMAELAAESAAVATHARVHGAASAAPPVDHYVALATALREEQRRLAGELRIRYLMRPFTLIEATDNALHALGAR